MEDSLDGSVKITPDKVISPPTPEGIVEPTNKEEDRIPKQEFWQMTRREFGNKFYVYGEHEHQSYCGHKDKSNSDIQSRKESGVITHGSFVLAKNNDVIEKARRDTEGGGMFLIVSADSLPPNKSLQKPLDVIKISRQARQSIPYIAEFPLGLDPHKYFVTQALREGKKVPREVLMQYPYLARAEGSLSESELSDIENPNNVKEPWQITRDEFGENYYLHGTTEDKAQLIRQAGGIQKGAFINVAQDRDHTAIAFATDSPYHGAYAKAGRGTTKGTIFISHINAILLPEEKMRNLEHKRRIREYNFSPPETIFEDDFKGRTIPYVTEVPDSYNPHRYLVEQALRQGKHVPPEVLEDYPGLEKAITMQKEIASMPDAHTTDLQPQSETPLDPKPTPKGLRKLQSNLLSTLRKLSPGNK